jgi:hypothetical protein
MAIIGIGKLTRLCNNDSTGSSVFSLSFRFPLEDMGKDPISNPEQKALSPVPRRIFY